MSPAGGREAGQNRRRAPPTGVATNNEYFLLSTWRFISLSEPFLSIPASRAKNKKMAAVRVLSDHRSNPLRQSVGVTAHIGHFRGQPDARRLRSIQGVQAGQPPSCFCLQHRQHCPHMTRVESGRYHQTTTVAEPNFYRGVASGGLGCWFRDLHFNELVRLRLAQSFSKLKKLCLPSPRSRQNALIVCPLPACSETSRCHFFHIFLLPCFWVIIPRACYLVHTPARWGLFIAHDSHISSSQK